MWLLPENLTLQELCSHASGKVRSRYEAFIHGALCYSFSGQCLMSSMTRRQKRQSWKMCTALPPCLSGSAGEWQVFIQTTGFLSSESERYVHAVDILPDILDAGVMSL
ncbi:MAG: U32 family peptidase [Blautia caecimuris]